MNHLIIAVDGPVASGKGTVSRLVAKKLGIKYIDSGAIYRIITYYLNQKKILPSNVNGASFKDLKIELGENWGFLLDGKEVHDKIRDPKICELSSDYAKIGIVREFANKIARRITNSCDCIVDGRDAGTFIVPNASLKIYLTASLEERTKRRLEDFKKRGFSKTFEEVRLDIEKRDFQDKNREISPLIKSPDAIEIDNSDMSIDEQVEKICELVRKS